MSSTKQAAKLQALIEEARALDGQLIGNQALPFDFALWLQGVNDGIADAALRAGHVQQGRLA